MSWLKQCEVIKNIWPSTVSFFAGWPFSSPSAEYLEFGQWRSRYHYYRQMAAQDESNGRPTLLASPIFDLYKHDTPQIKSQTMRHTLMNLVNTTCFEKYVDP